MAAGRSPRKAEAVNDERCDRDRVTAILARCAKHRARWPSEQNPSMTIKVRDVELLGRLLEALDTIDRLEGENEVTKNLLTDVVNPDNDEPALVRAMSAAEDWLWKDLT